EAQRLVHDRGGGGAGDLPRVAAEMVGQAAAPLRRHQRARRQRRAPPLAVDDAEMAAMLTGQQPRDQRRLAMRAGGQDEAGVAPAQFMPRPRSCRSYSTKREQTMAARARPSNRHGEEAKPTWPSRAGASGPGWPRPFGARHDGRGMS